MLFVYFNVHCHKNTEVQERPWKRSWVNESVNYVGNHQGHKFVVNFEPIDWDSTPFCLEGKSNMPFIAKLSYWNNLLSKALLSRLRAAPQCRKTFRKFISWLTSFPKIAPVNSNVRYKSCIK